MSSEEEKVPRWEWELGNLKDVWWAAMDLSEALHGSDLPEHVQASLDNLNSRFGDVCRDPHPKGGAWYTKPFDPSPLASRHYGRPPCSSYEETASEECERCGYAQELHG